MYIGKAKLRKRSRLAEHITISRGGPNKYSAVYSVIHKAIAKYGIDSFTYNVFQFFENESDALLAETYWIKFFSTKNRLFGYNLTDGGDGVSGRKVSKETRERISASLKGRIVSEDSKNRWKKSYNKNLKLHCLNSLNINCKAKWVDNSKLLELVMQFGLKETAKLFGVTDNALRGRLKRRGLLTSDLIEHCKSLQYDKLSLVQKERFTNNLHNFFKLDS